MADERESIAAADGEECAGGIDAGAICGFLSARGALSVRHRNDLSIAVWTGVDVHWGGASTTFCKLSAGAHVFLRLNIEILGALCLPLRQ